MAVKFFLLVPSMVFVVLTTVGCRNGHAVEPFPLIDRRTCSKEAVLLASTVTVLSEKGHRISLTSRSGIYLCGPAVAGWLPIMYPNPDEPVNCANREVDMRCPVGWVQRMPDTIVLG